MRTHFATKERGDPAFAHVRALESDGLYSWLAEEIGVPLPDVFLVNPWLSATAEGPATPEDHGFVEVETGGGCKAWEFVAADEDGGDEYLITDTGSQAPRSAEGGWMLGMYSDGDLVWLWTVHPDGSQELDIHDTEWVNDVAGSKSAAIADRRASLHPDTTEAHDPVPELRDMLRALAETVLSLEGTVIEDDENGGPILEQARQARDHADSFAGWE